MNDQELRELVANLAVRQEHLFDRAERLVEELARQGKETGRRLEETDRQKMETDRLMQENARRQEATDRLIQENALRQKETDRQLKELGKQIGGLGEKFGGFTEGMAFPSMRKILKQRFGMENVAARAVGYKNDRVMEVDVLAWANTNVNAVYLVEVKSHLREDGLQQMLKMLREFHEFFPGHQDKKIYGVLAGVDIPQKIGEKVLNEGIYLASIHDDSFELCVPEGFQPRAF